MRCMQSAHETGLPVMRPLFLGFPADQAAWEVDDQYLFGDDILVAPVITEGARERQVYLPAGAGWLDAWTGTRHDGGARITAAAPLDTIPVYLREGGQVRPFGGEPG